MDNLFVPDYGLWADAVIQPQPPLARRTEGLPDEAPEDNLLCLFKLFLRPALRILVDSLGRRDLPNGDELRVFFREGSQAVENFEAVEQPSVPQ